MYEDGQFGFARAIKRPGISHNGIFQLVSFEVAFMSAVK